MREMMYCSHCDPHAGGSANSRNSEMPSKAQCGNEAPYDKVLHAMRNQEMLFYSSSVRSGY